MGRKDDWIMEAWIIISLWRGRAWVGGRWLAEWLKFWKMTGSKEPVNGLLVKGQLGE
jgi:hypothetical protein